MVNLIKRLRWQTEINTEINWNFLKKDLYGKGLSINEERDKMEHRVCKKMKNMINNITQRSKHRD